MTCFRNGIHHDNYRVGEETIRGELEEDGGAPCSDPGTAQAGRDAQEIGGARWSVVRPLLCKIEIIIA